MDDERNDPASSGHLKQFSMREILLLIVIVALALGWWLDRRPIPARFQGGGGTIIDTATGRAWDKAKTDFYDPKPLDK